MIKRIVINVGIWILNLVYLVFKLRKTKKQITLVSRESDVESLDFSMIREKLKKNGKYKIVVLSRKLEKSPLGIISYLGHIFIQMWNFAASEVVVTDTYCISISVLKHKRKLKVIQIWHAISAIKQFGYQTVGKKDGTNPEVAEIMRMHKNYTYVISPSEIIDKHFAEAFGINEDKIVRLGLPRIDYIRDIVPYKKDEIYREYPELNNSDKKTVLYVPTMRKNRGIELKRFISVFDEKSYNVVIKLHPLDDETKEIQKENVIYDKKFLSYDFLSIADIVISDYSSFSIEASLLDRPLYFYLYDYLEYASTTGFNIDLMKEAVSCYVFEHAEDIEKQLNFEYNFKMLHVFRDKYIDKDIYNCTDSIVEFIEKVSS